MTAPYGGAGGEIDLMLAVWAALGYLLGSAPFGLLLTRLAGLGDIRQIGSGNFGATNVLRTGNKPLAAATLILDGGKGAAAVLIATAIAGPFVGLVAGFCSVLGHNFPVWLKFKGGKGVATTLGTLIAVAWPVGVAACATWLVVAALFRYSSLAGIVSLGVAPAYAFFLFDNPDVGAVGALLAILAIARHHENIRRLFSGTESKIGGKKT